MLLKLYAILARPSVRCTRHGSRGCWILLTTISFYFIFITIVFESPIPRFVAGFSLLLWFISLAPLFPSPFTFSLAFFAEMGRTGRATWLEEKSRGNGTEREECQSGRGINKWKKSERFECYKSIRVAVYSTVRSACIACTIRALVYRVHLPHLLCIYCAWCACLRVN